MGAFRNPGQYYKASVMTVPLGVGALRKQSINPNVPGLRDISLKFDGTPSAYALTFPQTTHIGVIVFAVTKTLSGMATPQVELTLRTAAEVIAGGVKAPTVTIDLPKDAPVGTTISYDFFADIEVGGSLTFMPKKAEVGGAGAFVARADYYIGSAPAPPPPAVGSSLANISALSSYYNYSGAGAFQDGHAAIIPAGQLTPTRMFWGRTSGGFSADAGAKTIRLNYGLVGGSTNNNDTIFTSSALQGWVCEIVGWRFDPSTIKFEYRLSIRDLFPNCLIKWENYNGAIAWSWPETSPADFKFQFQFQGPAAVGSIYQQYFYSWLMGQ